MVLVWYISGIRTMVRRTTQAPFAYGESFHFKTSCPLKDTYATQFYL